MFMNLFEAPEAEAARLAQSPVSSINHTLSTLPVNIDSYLQDLIIQMPRMHPDDTYTVIVVPFEPVKLSAEEIADRDELPRKRHTGWWTCLVVASDHPSYPVGGHRLSVPAAQLVRGTQRTLALTV
ncbi:hypothetical protein [Cryobacterium zhongshanensis]|uniref:Uncharacterized protein n=1 Tax=Cryobacterium zhongshanensis TaxID=2928153 RepID=A0AA41R2T1_9MICO|nr:hypothetical protein [Cryobacterium zhongshanensis]MCI4659776.1 hypothetical protein [Cryobacterium zhongshanensis]